MKKNSVFQFLKKPPLFIKVIVFTLTLICVPLSIFITVKQLLNSASYFCFAITAILFFYSIYLIILLIPSIVNTTKKVLESNKVTKTLLNDYSVRTITFSACTLVVNIAYALIQGVTAILSSSIWLGAIALYFITLSLVRMYAVFSGVKAKRNGNSNTIHRLKIYFICSLLLIFLSLALTAAVVQIGVSNSSFTYNGLFIYVAAFYTFFKLTVSCVHFVKAKNSKDPIVQSLRNINLADSAVSVLTLQTALLAEFGTGNGNSLNAMTGALVCTSIIIIGILSAIDANKKLIQSKNEQIEILSEKNNMENTENE